MYDTTLMSDVKDYKKGCYKIQDLEYAKENILKITKNRTKDNMHFLLNMYNSNIIDEEMYDILLLMIIYDFQISNLYVLGLITEIKMKKQSKFLK